MIFRWTPTLALSIGSLLAACATEGSPLPTGTLRASESDQASAYAPTFSHIVTPVTPVRALTVPTYDGSGQLVHPDIVHIPEGWKGWEYWMAFTPYARADSSLENPSIVVSHNGVDWSVPADGVNPLVPRMSKGYNSDPDLLFDPVARGLVLLYREVSSGYNRVKTMRSANGVSWSASRLLFRRLNHGMVSPSLTVVPGELPRVWYVDAGPNKCLKRTTRVMTQTALAEGALDPTAPEQGWNRPQRVALVQPGFFIWHLDITWIASRHEFWAIYPAYRVGVCGERSLFFARSADGVTWTTYKVPFLHPRDVPWMNTTVYRTTSLYDPTRNLIRLWISASATGNQWSLSYVEYDFSTFLTALENGVAESPLNLAPGSAAFRRAGVPDDDGP